MNGSVLTRTIPALVAAGGAVALALWLASAPDRDWQVRGTETGARPLLPVSTLAATSEAPPSVPLPGVLVEGEGRPAEDLGGSWPNFRGPGHDAVSREDARLARTWPAGGPEVLWSVPVGEGYAAPAVHRGRVYLLDYDMEKRADALRCLSLADGAEIWRRWYSNPISVQHGFSRTIPAVTDKYVVTLGPSCQVLCVDADTGQDLWAMDLVAEYAATVPEWYAGQCPLIDGDKAILAPGGSALMIAVDLASGKVLWRTPNPRAWKMTHSSVMPMTFRGRRTYVYCATGGVVGVDAATGEVLWEDESWKMLGQALCPSPVIVGEDRVFLSGGYNAGSMMLELFERDGRVAARTLFRLAARVFGSEQHTPVPYGEHLYGVRPDGRLVCLDLTGRVRWDSASRTFSQGYGPYMIADGLIFVMGPDGLLVLAEAAPEAYRELASAQVVGKESWGPMALAAGRLIVRDIAHLVCLDVRTPQMK